MHRTAGRLALALAGSFALTLIVHGQGQATPARPDLPRISGTEVSSEFSWERTTNQTLEVLTAVFGIAPFHITFSVTYSGLKLPAAPELVEVALVRESATAADVQRQTEAPPVMVLIDGLPVPMTKQTSEGPDSIKSVVPFEVFQWMVGGETLEFEVFGRRFALAPGQLRVLTQSAADWAHPSKTGIRD